MKLQEGIETIVLSWIGLFCGLALMCWGFVDEGWFRILIGLCIIYGSVSLKPDKTAMYLKKWEDEYEGSLIFYYPTRGKWQERIRQEILPLFKDVKVYQVYYDGPKLVSDQEGLAYKLTKMKYESKQIATNNPVVVRVEKGNLEIKERLEIMEALKNNSSFDIKAIELKIIDLVRKTNTVV